MTWDALFGMLYFGCLILQITFWIDPGWKDARKTLPPLDRLVRPLARFDPLVQGILWLQYIAATIWIVMGFALAVRVVG
jgi:hypothetical protein